MDPPRKASHRQRNFPSAASQTFFFYYFGVWGGVDCGRQGVICAGLQACSGLLRGCVTGFTGLIRLLSEGHEVELRGLGVATERIFFFFLSFLGSVLFHHWSSLAEIALFAQKGWIQIPKV